MKEGITYIKCQTDREDRNSGWGIGKFCRGEWTFGLGNDTMKKSQCEKGRKDGT